MLPKIISYETREVPHLQFFLESCRVANVPVDVLKRPPSAANSLYRKFCENYFHLSPNSRAFELACFERYFAIEEYLRETGINEFIMSDSDVLIDPEFGKLTTVFVENVDVMLSAARFDRDPQGILAEMSPHFSYWTSQSLMSFLSFVVKCYETSSGKDLIRSTAVKNKEIVQNAGISDMTLCALWVRSEKPTMLNSTSIKNGVTVDHNIAVSSHTIPDQFEMRFGAKRLIRLGENLAFCSRDGTPIRPIALHFQGRFKMIMKDVLEKNDIAIVAKSVFINSMRQGKSLLLNRSKDKN